ncbi:MerR family transcriptional regulator [Apilactobacillus apisilvae]|uniref:MerR family transcriptional regulator n=1 Tax=Apilactobacillus apisilvae TaxID=2923364 RepID=A0ABY4PFU3_9LACO|nr:MerR family transcriptional regulator [Apilactobacillus apisilvae]UQS84569.1 MerR family transcriptional regulator [Apilactobacillus apisilvae]
MKISQVTKEYHVSKQTLYYWERIGLLEKIKKDRNGYRNYTKNNLEQLEFITCMRNAGMTIEKLQKYMFLYKSGEKTYKQRKQLISDQLTEIKYQVLRYKNAQQMLEYKLAHYDELNNRLNKQDAK